MFMIFGPRFQNWDLRIRPLGGNFTENLMFRSELAYSSVQRSNIGKVEPRTLDCLFVVFISTFVGPPKGSPSPY